MLFASCTDMQLLKEFFFKILNLYVKLEYYLWNINKLNDTSYDLSYITIYIK